MDNLIWAATALLITAMLCVTILRGWRGWLDLRRDHHAAGAAGEPSEPGPGARIELADVRERLRKLEAIARGVDL